MKHRKGMGRRAKAAGMGALLLGALAMAGCTRTKLSGQQTPVEKADDAAQRPIVECLIKTTPVKNQGASSLCWAYAMLATIESEHLMMGDSVNLSAAYVGRMLLQEQAERYYLSRGQHAISMRGVPSMLLRLIEQYGVTHYDAFHGDINFKVAARKTERAAAAALARRTGIGELRRSVSDLLDEEMPSAPRFVFMLGAEYTTREFAHSVCRADEYEAFTSFTHHPFGAPFVLEVADNQYGDAFMNVPIDTLMQHVERALRSGHPVCWEGDISEPHFSFARGTAKLGDEHSPVTQQSRQLMFEKFQTTDDHCMELIGIVRSPQGKKYFLAKNSWGTANPFGGLMYLSENYLRAKTIAVWMARAGSGR